MIWPRESYLIEVYKQLINNLHYKLITTDPFPQLITDINQFVKTIHNNKPIDDLKSIDKTLKYWSVMDIVRTMHEIVRPREETGRHSRPCDERRSIERERLGTHLGESSSAVNRAPKTKRSCLKIHLYSVFVLLIMQD